MRRCASSRSATSPLLLIAAGRDDLLPHVRGRLRAPSRGASRRPTACTPSEADAAHGRRSPCRSTRSSASSARSLLVRRKFRGKALLNALIDLPFAISPGRHRPRAGARLRPRGWFGGGSLDHGIQIIFSTPGHRARRRSSSRCRSWCARSSPVLQEIGDDQEQAARRSAPTAGRPSGGSRCRRSAGASPTASCSPTARVLGEFGAVSVVSGQISGQTETLPLFVEKQFENFDIGRRLRGLRCVLALLALLTLLAMNLLNAERRPDDHGHRRRERRQAASVTSRPSTTSRSTSRTAR